MKCICETKIWDELMVHSEEIRKTPLKELMASDPKRFENFSVSACDLVLDYSKNCMNQTTFELLLKVTDEIKLLDKIEAMFNGEKINTTEDRAVLHIALRNKGKKPIYCDGEDVMPKVQSVLSRMRGFSEDVREGKWLGHTGKPITDVVNIGIGGSDLGPKMVCEALKFYAKRELNVHFVSNVDGTQIVETLRTLNPETTLFIVASKTFTTIETLTNANTAKKWLLEKLNADETATKKHFVAVSTNEEKVKEFGIDSKNMFEFWDWVGGRYSVWSAIGLSVMIYIGADNFDEFLKGAYDMDQHFFNAEFRENMPVLMGLFGVWHRDFIKTTSHAVIVYDDYLKYFMPYLQQMDMESNGKSISNKGWAFKKCSTGPVVWGGVGTDAQHSFHQLLHQGTDPVPVDFIVPIRSLNETGEHHQLLFANCLAQSKALAEGISIDEVMKELIKNGMSEKKAQELAPHKVMPGSRPSNTIVFCKLTPAILGSLIALYEHKVFVEGVFWNINSFDQWGVELGKVLAKKIAPDLEKGKDLSKYDSSTKGLIEIYRDEKSCWTS